MTGGLVLIAAAMGLAATPHCASMCAAACSAATRGAAGPGCGPSGAQAKSAGGHKLLVMMLGRLTGYALAGAVSASLVEAAIWLSATVSWVRPLWLIVQVLLLALGLVLLVRGRFPPALMAQVESLWQQKSVRLPWAQATDPASAAGVRQGSAGTFLSAMLWPAVPCGVLQAALMTAALASSAWEGAAVMLSFGLASVPGLILGRSLWTRIGAAWAQQRRPAPVPAVVEGAGVAPVRVFRAGEAGLTFTDTVPLRLAGLAVASTAVWWLVGHRLAPTVAAWCA